MKTNPRGHEPGKPRLDPVRLDPASEAPRIPDHQVSVDTSNDAGPCGPVSPKPAVAVDDGPLPVDIEASLWFG